MKNPENWKLFVNGFDLYNASTGKGISYNTVTTSGSQYTYDQNGNMTSDALNKNSIIKYDHRNLITELQHLKYILNDSITYYTYYSYDEAGNRFAKTVYRYTGEGEPTDTPEEESEGFYWLLDNAEIYSRDVSGREMAIYKNDTLLVNPVYGLDMIGKIKDEEVYFYMKDHLGSVRAVLNSTGGLVSAQDYDAWGYLLENRNYDSDDSKFKFTGKERDEESKYDYFGARYYDARIGRWGQVEPLLDKYLSLTPYNYSLNNPIRIIDEDGNGPKDGLMKNDAGVDWGRPGPSPGIGTALATATKELVIYMFDNPSTLWGMYKTVDLFIGALDESARLRYEYINSPYVTEEINVTSTFSNSYSEMNETDDTKQAKPLSKDEIKKLEGQYGSDVHQLKKDYLGSKSKISRHDVYKDKKTGEIIIKPKSGLGGIRTGIIIE